MNDLATDQREFEVHDITIICGLPRPHDHFFEIAHRVRFWLQLAKSHPALAVMIAYCWEFDGEPFESARDRMNDYTCWKRSRLCGRFGFPETDEAVRLLLKLEPEALESKYLFALRGVLEEPGCFALLQSVDTISCDLIQDLSLCNSCGLAQGLMSDTRRFLKLPHIQRQLLNTMYLETRSKPAGFYPEFTLKTMRQFGLDPLPFGRFSTAQKYAFHLNQVIKARARFFKIISDVEFTRLGWPNPPIPGTQSIEPIASAEELVKEGETMEHCGALYVSSVLLGSMFFYRVLNPQRATVALEKRETAWSISQIHGFQNATPDEKTVRSVREWLDANKPAAAQYSPPLSVQLLAALRAQGFTVHGKQLQNGPFWLAFGDLVSNIDS